VILGLIALGLLVVMGWARWPLRSPLAVFVCALPVIFWRASALKAPRRNEWHGGSR